MMDRYQEVLGFNDTEWKAVQPLVEDVMAKQRASRTGGGMMMMMGRGRGGGAQQGGRQQGGQQGDRQRRGGMFGGEPDQTVVALQEALESGASKSDIKTKLAAVRASRKKNEEALKKSQQTLLLALSPEQEARCVLAGLLP